MQSTVFLKGKRSRNIARDLQSDDSGRCASNGEGGTAAHTACAGAAGETGRVHTKGRSVPVETGAATPSVREPGMEALATTPRNHRGLAQRNTSDALSQRRVGSRTLAAQLPSQPRKPPTGAEVHTAHR